MVHIQNTLNQFVKQLIIGKYRIQITRLNKQNHLLSLWLAT